MPNLLERTRELFASYSRSGFIDYDAAFSLTRNAMSVGGRPVTISQVP